VSCGDVSEGTCFPSPRFGLGRHCQWLRLQCRRQMAASI
jgi:hypothetical protein